MNNQMRHTHWAASVLSVASQFRILGIQQVSSTAGCAVGACALTLLAALKENKKIGLVL